MKICVNYQGQMINNYNDNQIVPHIETIIDNVQSAKTNKVAIETVVIH